ncbi:MAG TPA: FAD-dependent oxidoreductase, partial [Phnomibacter sp.]|nr:FAD-dependent oxidoreductase [Phnomibacter sp.]
MLVDRKKVTEQIQQTTFDICIIGGGATGAGCALDAASRGFSVLLVEKEDFGSATSGKSTKLIHGGVRYLEQAIKKLSIGQFRMVRKALQERNTLLRIAPHLTRRLPLITPCRNWLEGLYYFVGLLLYDRMSGCSKMGQSKLLSKKRAVDIIPTLNQNHLFSAVLYYDGQLDDLRFNWALVESAMAHGAIAMNHASVTSFTKDSNGRLQTAEMVDHLLGAKFKVQARCFINATGPFADPVRQMANEKAESRIRVSSGVHVLLPQKMMPSHAAMLIPKTADGRLIFAIPYQDEVLVGTTDEEALLTDQEFGPTEPELDFLLEHVNDYLDINASKADVLAGFGGLRPLVKKAGSKTKDLVRDHEVEVDRQSGLISILGGKWTTYRLMAKDTVDAATVMLGSHVPCITHQITLQGGEGYQHLDPATFVDQCGFSQKIIHHLISKYGDKTVMIIALAEKDPSLCQPVLNPLPYTYAELHYVITQEMAYTVKDVIGRRWGVQLVNWEHALALIEPVGAYMKTQFQWNQSEEQLYIAHYKNE